MPLKSKNVIYLYKTMKMAGSGRKVKYTEQEAFIIKAAVAVWETGNPMRNNSTHDFLIYQFGHECEADKKEW